MALKNCVGERVRGWLSSELEVVVSAKEAEKTKDHLIADRKEFTAELTKLKTAMRRTQSQEERKVGSVTVPTPVGTGTSFSFFCYHRWLFSRPYIFFLFILASDAHPEHFDADSGSWFELCLFNSCYYQLVLDNFFLLKFCIECASWTGSKIFYEDRGPVI